MNYLYSPWPWYVAGPLIALTMLLLLYFGRRFGVSSNFQTMCTILGAGRVADYFKIDWRKNVWNLVFIAGTIVGGYIGHQYLSEDPYVSISEKTEANLHSMGIESAGTDYEPMEIFSWHAFSANNGWLFIIVGGFLVGFGTRYANGCTSGHAISGLSNLQLPSLIAVIGFFIGGLIMTWLLLPIFLN